MPRKKKTAAAPLDTIREIPERAFDNPTVRSRPSEPHKYVPHIWRIGEKKRKRYPARRRVVERTPCALARPTPRPAHECAGLSWLQKCRTILVRYDTKAQNYPGLIRLACALLWFRRLHRLANMRF